MARRPHTAPAARPPAPAPAVRRRSVRVRPAAAVNGRTARCAVRLRSPVCRRPHRRGSPPRPRPGHVGIYLGRDQHGRHRFASSRKTPDGPTMADLGALSVLDAGTELYSGSLRVIRRF
ncbi:hypothetical protein DDQ41_03280 [Streptomyces spongiicola]|uniref:NlpC/P60 domain-containing protein n=1 Tax=Streptomyces spongiicola TaxID=1690221 RepID=A0ABN5KF26_9ACTN|nr:hypothetical protein DDQ41_03280 [Streptomyces spongiicola]